MKHLFYLLISTVLLTGCSTYSNDEISAFDKQISDYLNSKDITCERSESGLYYAIIDEGEGAPIQFGDQVSFHYTGEFLDGKTFDQTTDEPAVFKVNQLIGAWKETILFHLKKGGKAFIVAPPQLGYGDKELDDIPANSILVFKLEVVDVN